MMSVLIVSCLMLLLSMIMLLGCYDSYIIRRQHHSFINSSILKLVKLHVLELPLQRNISMYQKIIKDEIDRLNDDHDGCATDVDDSDRAGMAQKHIIKWYLVKMTNTSAIAEVIVDVRTSKLSIS